MFTPDQIEGLEVICDTPGFVDAAVQVAKAARPAPRIERGQARKELERVRDAVGKLSFTPGVALLSYVPDLHDGIEKAIAAVDQLPRGDQPYRKSLGRRSQQLFEQFHLAATTQVDGDFVMFLDILIAALGTDWDARRLAKDTLL